MKLLRSLLVITPAAGVLALSPVAAHADGLLPAPPGQASAVAAQVGSLLGVSQTDATAGAGAPSAQATVISLAGQPLLGLGGAQTGDGDSAGALADTGGSLPARVQVAPWHAAASGTGTATRRAKSSAAVGRADLPDVVSAGVLTSDSEASDTDQQSTGTAVTNGVELGLLDSVRVVVLHSEADSTGQGHSYLASLNGIELGTDAQLGNSPLCALNAPGLLGLSCLTATGGTGAGGLLGAAANVATVTPALDALAAVNPVAAFTASASSGAAPAPIAPAPAPAPAVNGTDTSRGIEPAAIPPADTGIAAQAAGSLPRTGTPAASLAGTAFALLLSGLGLRRFGRRRTAH